MKIKPFLKSIIRPIRYTHWHVGLIEKPIEQITPEDVERIRWLPEPSDNVFWADPFGVIRQQQMTIFLEEFYFDRRHARIAALIDQGDRFERVPVEMDVEGHLSYPFLIEHDNELFCIPESGGANEVALYRNVEFPQKWHKEAILIDESFVDSTVIQDAEGHWWLWCYRSANDPQDSDRGHLYLYHADQLAGPWQPHPLNPVIRDSHQVRPAGTPYCVDGVWYRPAQDCTRRYGGGVVIKQVICLDREQPYQESDIHTLLPAATSKYDKGLHTLASVGDITLVDGKYRGFSLRRNSKILR